jgi:hypothetical protein
MDKFTPEHKNIINNISHLANMMKYNNNDFNHINKTIQLLHGLKKFNKYHPEYNNIFMYGNQMIESRKNFINSLIIISSSPELVNIKI